MSRPPLPAPALLLLRHRSSTSPCDIKLILLTMARCLPPWYIRRRNRNERDLRNHHLYNIQTPAIQHNHRRSTLLHLLPAYIVLAHIQLLS
jgi:hypothetical protein